jgi:hypothetical protein
MGIRWWEGETVGQWLTRKEGGPKRTLRLAPKAISPEEQKRIREAERKENNDRIVKRQIKKGK